jgi:uncharacterized protein YdeI (YjbR/CyaY-like superfamily)
MKMNQMLQASTRQDWRRWLENVEPDQSEIWLVFQKGDCSEQELDYDAAVEEGLCFGWIDSIIQRIDEARYARKFNRRTNWDKWSESNINRMRKLAGEGKVIAEVLVKLPGYVLEGEVVPRQRPDVEAIPAWIEAALRANEPAWSNFQGMPPSQRRLYLGWILDAKREETRLRRLAEAVPKLIQNQKMGLK